MKVIIFGASGFLGGKLYKNFKLKEYNDVIGTCYSNRQNDLIELNAHSESKITNLLSKIEPNIIIWCLLSKEDENSIINNGLSAVVKYARDANTKVIYVSSDAFGDGVGNYTEDHVPIPISTNNPLSIYANAKIEGEKLVQRLQYYTILRIGPIYGQSIYGKWDKRVSNIISSLENKEIIVRPNNLFKTFIHIDDLVDSISEIIDKDYNGIIHVGPDLKESYYSFALKITKWLGYSEEFIKPDMISLENAKDRGIPLDTSLNTRKFHNVFKTKFREL